MNVFRRDYRKLKTLDDFSSLDAPGEIHMPLDFIPTSSQQMVLRMLVRPKYGDWYIPGQLEWLNTAIRRLSLIDSVLTGITNSWCYVTVRHGPVVTKTDDEWHFDGASFRTSLIPERNYIWMNHTPTQYKLGTLEFPDDFDPVKHNLFSYASNKLKDEPIHELEPCKWYLINPFCLHRRNPNVEFGVRTFIRISFPDIEGRDVNNTPNPLLDTPAFGRDPVRDFRNKLVDYEV